MKKVILSFLVILLSSCETNNKIFKTEIIKTGKNFKGIFQNYIASPDSLTGERKQKNESLLNLFGIYSNNVSNLVSLEFNETGELKLNYIDSSLKKSKILFGKYKNSGYYQCFLENKVIQIPPFVPFIYSRRMIDRLRIGITSNGSLVIEKKYVSEGNIFIFGAGASYKETESLSDNQSKVSWSNAGTLN